MNQLAKLTTYFKESYIELKKVVWPTKKQLTNYSLVVFGMFIGIAIFFAILDNIFNRGLEVLIK